MKQPRVIPCFFFSCRHLFYFTLLLPLDHIPVCFLFFYYPWKLCVCVCSCRFQVHEDTDASLDNLSDCSSDSMEVCCDDLGEFVWIWYCGSSHLGTTDTHGAGNQWFSNLSHGFARCLRKTTTCSSFLCSLESGYCCVVFAQVLNTFSLLKSFTLNILRLKFRT